MSALYSTLAVPLVAVTVLTLPPADSTLTAATRTASASVRPPLAASALGVQSPARSQEGALGTIRGRVLAADTGLPLQGVEVKACCLADRDPVATTDSTGSYELSVPAGRYRVRATKTAFLTMDYGEDVEGGTTKEVEVGDGAVVERIDVRLPRGGVIEGRVVDQYGEPMSRVRISARMRIEGSDRLYPVRSERRPRETDDRGRYRLFGLPPGVYCIAASASDTAGMMGSVQFYYPGVLNRSDPECFEVGVSEERQGIDFVLPAR